jgi:hypothetical protein
MMRRCLATVAFLLIGAAPLSAAPIFADVSIEGGIHVASVDTFEGYIYWTPAITDGEVLTHPLALSVPLFDGKYFRVDLSFPDRCGGTFQVDAYWHGGWFGELRPNPNCVPVCLTCGPTTRTSDPVPEPAVWWLLASAFAVRRLVA